VKALEKGLRMKLHLYGVLIHGHPPMLFTLPDHVANGSNTTIEIIQRVLIRLEETDYREGGLPDTLYLQLDNTSRQNKNKFVFGFLGCLIAQGIFREVIVSFLPVGHTHEDIDQMFSRFSVRLRWQNTPSRVATSKVCSAAYATLEETNIIHLDSVGNISQYLDEKKFLQPLPRVMNYRQFKLSRYEGRVIIVAREKASGDAQFYGLDRDTVDTFSHRTFLFRPKPVRESTDPSTTPLTDLPYWDIPRYFYDIPLTPCRIPTPPKPRGQASSSSSSSSSSAGSAPSVDNAKVQQDMLKRYRQRIQAADEFWELSPPDKADLDAVFGLYARTDPFPPEFSVWGMRLVKDEQNSGASRRVSLTRASGRHSGGHDQSDDHESDESPDDEGSQTGVSGEQIRWDVGSVVCCRTEHGDQFWLGRIIPEDTTDSRSSSGPTPIRVHWYVRKNKSNMWAYKPAYRRVPTRGKKGRNVTQAIPHTDYIERTTVQGNVELGKTGIVLKKYRKWIEQYVLEHWANNPTETDNDEDDPELDGSDSASDPDLEQMALQIS
jgi:hypothetical protein